MPTPATAARPAHQLVRLVVSLPGRLVLALIWVYRKAVSPMLPRSCRFYPSCSVYAEQAVRTHGLLRGGWLAVRRLGRCHPWTPGGVDHVPPPRGEQPAVPHLPETPPASSGGEGSPVTFSTPDSTATGA